MNRAYDDDDDAVTWDCVCEEFMHGCPPRNVHVKNARMLNSHA